MNQPGLAASFVDAELGMGKEAQQNVRNLVLPWMPPKEATSAPPFMLPTPPTPPQGLTLAEETGSNSEVWNEGQGGNRRHLPAITYSLVISVNPQNDPMAQILSSPFFE